jgi:hypothetical protein
MTRRSRSKAETPSANTAPPPFFPLVMRVPSEGFSISEAQFVQLEEAGQIKLGDEQRGKLQALANFWITDLAARRSPRPKVFRNCLDDVINASLQLERVCQWDEHPLYHLIHWAMETKVDGAPVFPRILASAEQGARRAREMAQALKKCLPSDPGRQRPFDDDRRIRYLSEIYEQAGGKATAYLSSYTEKGMADTPFRNFAQSFYSMLPAEDKRDPGGLDDALRFALIGRPAKAKP